MFNLALAGFGFSLIYAFIVNWQLAFVLSLFIPVSFLASTFVGKLSTGVNQVKDSNKKSEETAGRIVHESVENIRTVVSLGREVYFINRFKDSFRRKYLQQMIILHPFGFVYAVSNALLFFLQLTAFSFGWYLMLSDQIYVGDLFSIYAVITFSAMLLGRVYAQMLDEGRGCRQAAKTVFSIIDRKSKIDPFSTNGLHPDRLDGDICFDNVYFSYPNRSGMPVLRGFTMTINKNQSNALVGHSGKLGNSQLG